MSIDLGLVPLTPQTGHCARAASQALLKELLGKGLARGWGEGAPSPSGVSGCVASAGQALVGRKGPTPFWGLTCIWRAKRSLDGMRGKNEGLEGTFSGPDKSKNGFLQGAEVRGMIRIWR